MSLESLKASLEKHSLLFTDEELKTINDTIDKALLRITDASSLKEKGNQAYKEKEYLDAIEKYTNAIKIDPTNEVLYSNRAAAYAKIDCDESGIDDSLKAIELNPNFIISYLRLGDFYMRKDKKKALFFYEVGLLFDKGNIKLINKVDLLKKESNNALNKESSDLMQSDEFKDLFKKVTEDKELMEKLQNFNKK